MARQVTRRDTPWRRPSELGGSLAASAGSVVVDKETKTRRQEKEKREEEGGCIGRRRDFKINSHKAQQEQEQELGQMGLGWG